MSTVSSFLTGEFLLPERFMGALFYALVFLLIAALASRALRIAVRHVLERDQRGLIDRTAADFLTQLAQGGIYLFALIFYAHVIPALRALGTGLLTGASVASVIVGLAAQSTLGNLIAGFALVIYRPFQLQDVVQVTAPGGPETGVVENLTLGYTILRTPDNRRIVVPNNTMASGVMVNLTAADDRGRPGGLQGRP